MALSEEQKKLHALGIVYCDKFKALMIEYMEKIALLPQHSKDGGYSLPEIVAPMLAFTVSLLENLNNENPDNSDSTLSYIQLLTKATIFNRKPKDSNAE